MSDWATEKQRERFDDLRRRRDRLRLVGLTMERDLAALEDFLSICDDPTKSVDDLLDVMEHHLLRLEGEFGS